MNYDELEREGLIKRLPISEKKFKDSLNLAERDLKTAKRIVEEDPDWAYTIAYNSMLQAARALMFSKGYRPSGKAQHVSVIRFCEAFFGKEFSDTIIYFDRMRRKRHIAVYDRPGSVSGTEATNAIKRAKEFLKKVEGILGTLS